MTLRVVLAVDTSARLGITDVGVAITVASLTVGEVPEAGPALIAFSTVRVRSALTLSRGCVTEVVESTDTVTITGFASFRTEAVGSWGALIAASPYYVQFAHAVTAVLVAELRQGTSRVALTREGAVEDVRSNAAVVLLAHFWNLARLDQISRVGVAVILFKFFTSCFRRNRSVEPWDFFDSRN
jgi:hypothetical protein